MADDGPRRRVQITLDLGADSWDDVVRGLHDIATQIALGQHRGQVTSGGYSWGYIWQADEDEAVDHDSWAGALNAWLERERRAPTTEEPSDE